MLDSYPVDRDELIRPVLAQREALTEQAALVAQLRAEPAATQATRARLAQRVGELAQRVRELEDRQPPTKTVLARLLHLVCDSGSCCARMPGAGHGWSKRVQTRA